MVEDVGWLRKCVLGVELQFVGERNSVRRCVRFPVECGEDCEVLIMKSDKDLSYNYECDGRGF